MAQALALVFPLFLLLLLTDVSRSKSSASCGGEANVRLPVGVGTVPKEGDAGEDAHKANGVDPVTHGHRANADEEDSTSEGLEELEEDGVGTKQVTKQDAGDDDHVANGEALEEED